MPTKTVIFTALEKFTDGRVRNLTTAEYIQMAGRAGRRGKDVKGTVLYLPQREPIGVLELQSIIQGTVSSFQSRMNFQYEFVIQLLNSQKSVITLLEGSYWYALLELEREKIRKELRGIEHELSLYSLTEEQVKVCKERDELEETIATTQNAKKKAALRNLQGWKDSYKESVWNPVVELYHKKQDLHTHSNNLKQLLEGGMEAGESSVRHRIRFLEECGFVTRNEESEVYLSQTGYLASEIHEGHPFLLVSFFQRLIKQENYKLLEILQVLSVFLKEDKQEYDGSIEELSVDTYVKEELWNLIDDAKHYTAIEKTIGIPSNPEYWEIRIGSIERMSYWITNPEEPLAGIAAKFEVFEGTLQKEAMKLLSLVEELQALATLSTATDLLTVLEGAKTLLLHDVVVAESLYLRLS
jgi:superfamily II RNA helicase